jgi:S1-C subfamily serine protease
LGRHSSYIPVDGKPVVGLVRQSSQAYKNGFRRGDIIVSINGTAINSFDDFNYFPQQVQRYD